MNGLLREVASGIRSYRGAAKHADALGDLARAAV